MWYKASDFNWHNDETPTKLKNENWKSTIIREKSQTHAFAFWVQNCSMKISDINLNSIFPCHRKTVATKVHAFKIYYIVQVSLVTCGVQTVNSEWLVAVILWAKQFVVFFFKNRGTRNELLLPKCCPLYTFCTVWSKGHCTTLTLYFLWHIHVYRYLSAEYDYKHAIASLSQNVIKNWKLGDPGAV